MKAPGTGKSRRQTQRDEKRDRILKVAYDLLRSHGYERLSLRAVAAHAAISPAGMYEYFADKQELLGAVAATVSGRLQKAMARAAGNAPSPRARLVDLGLAYVHFAQRHTDDFMLLYGWLRSRRRSLGEAVPDDSPYGIIRAAVAELLDPVRLAGTDVPILEGLAYGFWSTIHGMALLRLTHLAGFHADFEGGNRLVLESMADAWARSQWGRAR